MGAASRGAGCVGSGKGGRKAPSSSMGTKKVVMAKDGGAISQHKRMAMKGVKKMRYGGSCG
jgi:hypothetical protein